MTKDAAGNEITEPKVEEKMLPQSQVDAIVQDRLARDRASRADYDDLKKFKYEHEKQLDEAKQKELEAQKEYEKLKEGWTKKEQEYAGIISKKDLEITDMKIGSSLMGEIVKQNAYAEETMALIKSQAVFDKEGNIRIKGRDANGLEVMDSVEEGIKKFLTARPHLVKANKPGGGGTATGNQVPGPGAGDNDLNSLNAAYLVAKARGDSKELARLRPLMTAAINAGKTKL